MSTEEQIAKAAEILQRGGLVAFPTETVYGLGAAALDEHAVQRIFAAKERPLTSPLIVHVSHTAMAKNLITDWPPIAARLANRFWPGPLTIILPKRDIVPDLVTAGLPSVGVRIPAHPIAIDLIRRAGIPIAAPSANRFGEISPTTADHVRKSLGGRVDLILDGGPAKVGIESTVVSLTGEVPRVLRPGMITIDKLEEASGVLWAELKSTKLSSESPGLRPRHYAPKTPFHVLERGQELPEGTGRILDLPDDPATFAKQLYAEMHEADEAGWDWLAIASPPDTVEWSGIRDRLRRASGMER
jgi:L-threonylcarbamoyladenylate synthase